jgi:peptidoglycan/xylan/chitin deacetylase (PgdA/CDA1 family)
MATPILMYHSIRDKPVPGFERFTVSTAVFEAQLRALRTAGYRSCTVSELISSRTAGHVDDRVVVLTFDDAFCDFHQNALPLLHRHGMAATLYVATDFVGKSSHWLARHNIDEPIMSWSEIRDAQRAGVEIGAHSLSHAALDACSKHIATNEIVGSKHLLEDKLGQEVQAFAYPFGYHNRVTQQLVARAGFTSACAVRYRNSSDLDDPYRLSRLLVRNEMKLPNARHPREQYNRLRSSIWHQYRSMVYGGIRHAN